ncbi:acetyltransferase [Shewanella sp. 10N.286.45.A1]|uniref:acetyltransferase n=1 Tax=Shewanella sp. 10N.286.45.A1 TaxID=3229694 RepID=UPI003553D192
MASIAILGASGHGKVLAEIAELNGYDKVVFFDDNWPKKSQLEHWSIVGNSQDLIQTSADFSACIVAIGDNKIRLNKLKELSVVNAPLVSLIHPSAIISPYSSIGLGSAVMANAVVNTASTIGQGAIINTACSIDHDCVISEGVHVSPGAHLAGGIRIGKLSWIGIGSSIKQGVTIGHNVIVGAGAAVVSNINNNTTVVGVPAKPYF